MSDFIPDVELYNAPGRVGFVDAMNRFHQLYEAGHAYIDIQLVLGEEFDKDMVDTVLQEARIQGFI